MPVERYHERQCKVCNEPVYTLVNKAGRPRETHRECKGKKPKTVQPTPLEVIIPDNYDPYVHGLNNMTRQAIRLLIQKPAKRRAYIVERMERGMRYHG